MIIAIEHHVHRHSLIEGSCPLSSSAIHCRFVDGLWGSWSPPVFPANGSLFAAPPFPPSGPGEPSSPLSAVLRRRYDFPPAHLRSLIGSLPQPTRSSRFVFAAALPEGWRTLPGPGFGLAGRPPFRRSLVWTRMGSLRSSGDPSRAFAPFHDPGRTDVPLPLTVTSMLPPLPIRRRLRHWLISGLTPAASAPRRLRFALRVATRAQGSLPAGWLAFAGRASNPLDRFERFRFV
jgi:hypothetical protein